MDQFTFWWSFLVAVLCAGAVHAEDRPKIIGIDHVAFYTTSADANQQLYSKRLGMVQEAPLEPGQIQRFMIGRQWVGYSPAPDNKATNRMNHVAFATSDAEALRLFLKAKGVEIPDQLAKNSDGNKSFEVRDPEGNRIEFIEHAAQPAPPSAAERTVSRHIIHAGFIVRNRKVEDSFYKDLLGFHLYWQGGMHADKTDWVAMQVPDGTDWLEYMLNIESLPDLKTTGVMNHISLGVVDMRLAEAKLIARGWEPHGDERRQMGRDGKWQLNLYDLDWSRVELMEYKPVQKPCCSDFSGPHPQEP